MCYCYKNKKMTRTFDLQQSQRREDEIETERAYEIIPNRNTRASEVTYTKVGGLSQPQNGTAMEVVFRTVQGTNTQSSHSTMPNIEPTSQEFHSGSACNDPHRMYHILTNENEPTIGKNGGPVFPSTPPDLETDSPELSSVYDDDVAKKDSQTSLFSALDHTKPKGQGQPGQQGEIKDPQHANNLRLASNSQVLLAHTPPMVVYETIDKFESQKAMVLPGQPVYSTQGVCLVNKSKSNNAVEGLPKMAASKTETVKKTTEAIDTSTAGGQHENVNSDMPSATIPEETEVSQGACVGSGSQADGNTESKQRKVSAIKRSTKKLPIYDVVTKQDLMTSVGDTKGAIYSTLDHTKPCSQKTSRQSEDTYNSLQHTKNSRLAHSVSGFSVLLMPVPPTVVYETIDNPTEVATALPSQTVYSTLGTPKYSTSDRRTKSTSGIRNEAATGLNDCSATGSNTAAVGRNSPSAVEGMGGMLVPPKSEKGQIVRRDAFTLTNQQ